MSGNKNPATDPERDTRGEVHFCSVCHVELRDSSEWVRSKKKILCAACYQSLLYPNRKQGSQELLD